MQKPRSPQYIAAAVTLLAAFALLALLWYTQLGYNREQLAAASIPEEPADEEVYIQPEMLTPKPTDDADEQADQPKEAEAEALGLPEKVDVVPPKTQQSVHSQTTTPTRSNENLTTQSKPSTIHSEPAKPNLRPDETRLSDRMGAQFNAHNGSTSGRHGSAGSGGNGTNVSSQGLKGRTFHGYAGQVKSDKPFKANIKIRVTVTAEGKVKNAWLLSAGGAPTAIAQQCVAWARRCSWSAKPGAADADGVITYNVVINP